MSTPTPEINAQNIGARFSGGAIFGVTFVLLASLWTPAYPVLSAIISGIVIGGWIAISIADEHAKAVGLLRRCCRPMASGHSFIREIVRGLATTRFVCIVFGVPFSAVLAILVCVVFTIAAFFFSGSSAALDTFVDTMNGSFWWCGLYLHAVLIAGAVTMLVQYFMVLMGVAIQRCVVVRESRDSA